jgi:hypothetical protein
LVFTRAISARPPEVRLEAPDPLLRVEHRVAVALGPLELDVEAVRDDLVAGLPGVDAGTVRSTTPARSEPTMWYGRSWRFARSLVRP